jgi:hypothetical protein
VLTFRTGVRVHGGAGWGNGADAVQDNKVKESGDIMSFNTGHTCIVGRGGKQEQSECAMEGND